MAEGLNVTVWNEGRHEKTNETVAKIYPEGMGHRIAQSLEGRPGIGSIRVCQLDDPDHGLTEDVFRNTDVMTWWGHTAHHEVRDDLAERVRQRVNEGMGLVVLHSGHFSKPFKLLMGTNCDLRWRDNDGKGEKERIWVTDPAHPIAHGLPPYFEIEHAEMYGEHFNIPRPDHVVFTSWFQGGDVFRSGCCWHRGHGKVFYFRPGHETFPIYYDETILKVIYNGIRWAAPTRLSSTIHRDNAAPLEELG